MSKIQDDLAADRAQYGTGMTNVQAVEMLNRVAWRNPGWGLLSKPGGNNGRRSDGALCAVDQLFHRPSGTIRDVLGSAGDGNSGGPLNPDGSVGGPTTLQWGDEEQVADERFVAPIMPGAAPGPVPSPIPDPVPPPDYSVEIHELLVAVGNIQRALAGLDDRVTSLFREIGIRGEDTQQRLSQLASYEKQDRRLTVGIFGTREGRVEGAKDV